MELLETVSEEGKLPVSRVRDSIALNSIWQQFKIEDNVSSMNRAKYDAVLDGEAPYNQNELKRLGQGDRCNLNFNQAEGALEHVMAGYLDLINSVDTLFKCHTTHGDDNQRQEWSDIISEEFHVLLKDWPEFEYNFQKLAKSFVYGGVGFAVHNDSVDWRWFPSDLSELKVPRGTKANENDIEIACIQRVLKQHILYNFIRNEEVAKELGWNVDAVKEVLAKVSTTNSTTTSAYDWEGFQRQIKDNDLFVGHSLGRRGIKIIHGYINEFDGTITHLQICEDLPNKFLYQFRGKYNNMGECLTMFTSGIGNGDLYSIRGLGYKIFRHIQVNNRLLCHLVDGTTASTALMIQPQTAEDMENINLTYFGPWMVLNPNLKFIERQIPNLSANTLPVIQELTSIMQNNTSLYSSQSLPQGNVEQTKFEVQARLQSSAVLSAAQMNLFYGPWGRLGRETFRRIQNPNYLRTEPGGKEVWDFKLRCKERGVPMEAIEKVTRVSPVRAVGYGSAGQRLVAMDEFMQMLPAFDEQGRNNVLRDRVAARVGWDGVERYVGRLRNSVRQPIDAKIAMLENDDLKQGNILQVVSGENHAIHLQNHLGDMNQSYQQFQAGQLSPEQMFTYLSTGIPHSQQHLQQVANDKTRQQDVKQATQILGSFMNLAKQLQKQLQQNAQNQPQQGGVDPEIALKAQRAQARIQIETAKTQQKMQLKQAEARQRMGLKDAQVAHKLNLDKQKQNLQPQTAE